MLGQLLRTLQRVGWLDGHTTFIFDVAVGDSLLAFEVLHLVVVHGQGLALFLSQRLAVVFVSEADFPLANIGSGLHELRVGVLDSVDIVSALAVPPLVLLVFLLLPIRSRSGPSWIVVHRTDGAHSG